MYVFKTDRRESKNRKFSKNRNIISENRNIFLFLEYRRPA
jgi:hypothetical protein